MSSLKQYESPDRLTTGHNKVHRSFRQAGQADRIDASKVESDGITPKQTTFAEDFMLEHSHLFIAMLGSASRIGASKETQKSTQHYGFPA